MMAEKMLDAYNLLQIYKQANNIEGIVNRTNIDN